MDDLMVNVKVPRAFRFDLLDGTLICHSSDLKIVKCLFCPYLGTENCIALKIKKGFKLCVEEEEVTSAVAGAGKSSYRDSDKPHLESPERSSVLNP